MKCTHAGSRTRHGATTTPAAAAVTAGHRLLQRRHQGGARRPGAAHRGHRPAWGLCLCPPAPKCRLRVAIAVSLHKQRGIANGRLTTTATDENAMSLATNGTADRTGRRRSVLSQLSSVVVPCERRTAVDRCQGKLREAHWREGRPLGVLWAYSRGVRYVRTASGTHSPAGPVTAAAWCAAGPVRRGSWGRQAGGPTAAVAGWPSQCACTS